MKIGGDVVSRPSIEFIRYECNSNTKCCYNCEHCFEDESINGNWNLFCSIKEGEETFVLSDDGEDCDKYKNVYNQPTK